MRTPWVRRIFEALVPQEPYKQWFLEPWTRLIDRSRQLMVVKYFRKDQLPPSIKELDEGSYCMSV